MALAAVAPAAASEQKSAPARWTEGARAWVSGLWKKDANLTGWTGSARPWPNSNYQGTLVMVSGTTMKPLGVLPTNSMMVASAWPWSR
jgi:hypothetical protein